MRIIFFGTAEFAVPALRALIDSSHKVVAVVTQPDRQKGRHLKVGPSAAKVVAESHNVPVLQPQDASSTEPVERLKAMKADLFVVVAFGQILKGELLSLPRLYSVNIHGSLLPKYRGAAPTNRAIINGDTKTGVTIIKMNERMDEGDILSRAYATIDADDTNITLSERLSELGAKTLMETLEPIENGSVVPMRQDESQATYAPKLKKEDGRIDWKEPAAVLHNKVRGFLPWPGAYTYYGGRTMKVLNTEVSGIRAHPEAEPGEVLAVMPDGIVVKTGSGSIAIKYLQLEGKKATDSAAFARGHSIRAGYVFSSITSRQ